MADNFTITPGVGKTIAADDIAGVYHQRVKISLGADGSATDLSDDDPMPTKPKNKSTVVKEANETVNTSSSVIAPSNATRLICWIKNIGSVTAYVSCSGTATTGKPTRLEAGASMTVRNYDGAISAITGSSTTTLEVVDI